MATSVQWLGAGFLGTFGRKEEGLKEEPKGDQRGNRVSWRRRWLGVGIGCKLTDGIEKP